MSREICFRAFLMPGVEDTGANDFISKFLRIAMDTGDIEFFEVETIMVR